MEKFIKKFIEEIKMNKEENKELDERMNISWDKYGYKKSSSRLPFLKYSFIGLLILFVIATLLIFRPEINLNNDIPIERGKPVNAKELIKKMVYEVESLSHTGNIGHVIYVTKDSIFDPDTPMTVYVETYYDLSSYRYKINRRNEYEKSIVEGIDDMGESYTAYYSTHDYVTYYNGVSHSLAQFEFDINNYGDNATIYTNDYYSKVFADMNAVDPVYENAKAYEIILNLVSEESITEEIIEIKAIEYDVYTITMLYDLEVWNEEKRGREIITFEIKLSVSQKTFLPVQQSIRRADQDMYLITTDYITIDYQNFSEEEKENLFTIDKSLYPNALEVVDTSHSDAEILGELTYSGTVKTRYLGERYTLGALETENETFLLDGPLMYDWESTGMPTNLVIFLIGQEIEVTGIVVDPIYYDKKIYVKEYKIKK